MPPLFPNVWGTSAFVLDVSVPLRWLVVSQGNLYTSEVLSKMSSNTVAVSAGWPSLLADRIRAAEIAGTVTAARADRFLSQLRSVSIFVDPMGEQVWDASLRHARVHQLQVREAEMLELALRLDLPLATDDVHLATAATVLGIPIFQP